MRERIAAAGGLVVMACAALGLVACRQILGLEDAGACGLPSSLDAGPAACGSCTQDHCCNEWSACAQDPSCAPYEQCLAGCSVGGRDGGSVESDPACRSRCTINNPVPAESSGTVSALSACLAAKCETQCGLTCGAFAGYLSEPEKAPTCESCLKQNACTHARACGSSADCDAFWRCVMDCPTIDCKEACPGGHDAGVAKFRTLFQDFSGTCADSCGFGSYWACVGHVAGYPVPQASTISWTNWVYDVGTQLPVAGATLAVCPNCPCNSGNFPVLTRGQTGPDGFFTLKIPLNQTSSGPAQLFCIETNASGYLTNFFFPGIPYSEPSTSIKDGLGPPVSLGLVLFSQSNYMLDVNGLGGGHYDSHRGMIAAGIFDCFANPADNVLVSIDSNDPLAVLPGPVDAGADAGWSTLSGGINTTGHAVFWNLTAGTYVLTATPPGPPGMSKPLTPVTVTVAPNTVTQLGIFPGPTGLDGGP